jgi:methionyl-tRNA formyltransferase
MSQPLFAFFGTPACATIVLDRLEANGFLPALVVTAPDRPSGRGMKLTPSPVKVWALERSIDVVTPTSLKDEAFIEELQNTEWDVFITAAYAKLIPKAILDLPVHGNLNVHPSLLPKFRGPSPVLSAILADERTTGVTIMEMDEKLDEGPIIAQARVEISEEEWPPTGSVLTEMLFTEGGNLLSEILPLWLKGEISPEPQTAGATYTKKFTPEDARVQFEEDARQNFLKIQAFDAGPRAYFIAEDGTRVIVREAQWENDALQITRVLPEGRREMSYQDFLRGIN